MTPKLPDGMQPVLMLSRYIYVYKCYEVNNETMVIMSTDGDGTITEEVGQEVM